LARERGCTTEAVLNALRRTGTAIRETKPHMSQTEKDEARKLYVSGMTMKAVAQATGRTLGTISRLLNVEFPDVVRSKLTGPGGPHWLGGKSASHGYIYVWIAPSDPLSSMAQKTGYVAEHRIVMARHLGRALLPTETVHHINGNTSDNRLKNLQLRQGKHGRHVVMCCLDCGSRRIGHTALD
jgi:hypothetical protein